ncbi:MAG: hypothetical protein JWM10_1064 [Myxococcaceae bacterium]|nr:hypothetical protein [Myxococcaceae bacterium]
MFLRVVRTSQPLAANAAAAHAARVARLKLTGERAITRVRDLRARIEDDFLEIGQELARLDQPGMVEALGYESFAALCEEALGMSLPKAKQLIAITTRLSVELARALTQDRAAALLALVDATPEDDEPEAVLRATLTLPDGAKLDVDKASTQAIWEGARAIRRAEVAKAGKRSRGRTVSPDEQATAAAIAKAIQRVEALATTEVTLKAGAKGRALQARPQPVVVQTAAALGPVGQTVPHARQLVIVVVDVSQPLAALASQLA